MTWLYLPPGAIRGATTHALTASRSAQEQAASTSASTSPVPDIALWVTSSGKPSQQPLSWRGWKTKPWIRHLSGTTYRVEAVAYDRYAFRRFEEEVAELGLDLAFVEHPQGGTKRAKPAGEMTEGLWMPGSLRHLEELILEGRIRLRRNPVLISAMMSAVTETDRWDNKWLSKQRAINKIDAAVALCMAVGAAMAGDTSGSIDDWLKSLAS